MNFRGTVFLFGLLLTTLWIFGLMIAHKKAALDQSLILPSLSAKSAKVNKVIIKGIGKDNKPVEMQFEHIGERWYLKEGTQKVRVPNFKVDDRIIKTIKDARHEEVADVSNDLAGFKLAPPQLTVELIGKEKDKDTDEEKDQTWKFFVGKESADHLYLFVNSSDRPDKVFAVTKRSLDSFLTEDQSTLRSTRLFDFNDKSVTAVKIKTKSKDLELQRGDNNLWKFVQPPLGFAGYSADAPDEKKMPDDPFHKKTKPKEPDVDGISGVKALLDAILKVKVDDEKEFVELGKPHDFYGVELDKANMRIDITTLEDNKESKDVMIVSKKERNEKGEWFCYVRLDSDDGVMRINAKYFEPIDKALDDPGNIRSKDVSFFDQKKVDCIVLKQRTGKEKPVVVTFFKAEGDFDWQMHVEGTTQKKKADSQGIEALLEQVHGKKAIVEFEDFPAAELEKAKANAGLDNASEIVVYVNGLEKPKKDDKKDEPEKKDKDKKAEMPTLKKDGKAVVSLAVGNVEKDLVNVQRTLQDGTTISYFKLKKEFAEKAFPPSGIVLAYLDTALPATPMRDITTFELTRTTDKGPETLELQRHDVGPGQVLWYIKDKLEPSGYKLAESNHVTKVVQMLAQMSAEKWVKQLGKDEDLGKYGLKKPAANDTIIFTLKKNPVTKETAVSLVGVSAIGFDQPLQAATLAIAGRKADKGELVTIEIGKKESEQEEAKKEPEKGKEKDKDKKVEEAKQKDKKGKEKDKTGSYFAKHSGSDLLFLVPEGLVKMLKEVDVRDRSYLLLAQLEMDAFAVTQFGFNPMAPFFLASPMMTGAVHQIDPDKVMIVRLAVRSRFESRVFTFTRNADKTWLDASNLTDFHLDNEKVNELVDKLCKLQADRFVAFSGGPRDEHKLGEKEGAATINLTLSDNTKITLRIGDEYQNHGYFANSSLWPQTIFFVPRSLIDPLLRGVDYFGKDRAATN